MKKLIIIFVVSFLAINANAQLRHRLSNGEPYDIFLSVKPTGGIAYGEFNKNYTYLYGGSLSFEMQLEETKLGLGVELGYNYCVPQAYKRNFIPTKYNWAAHQFPITLNTNYYFYNEVCKPFIGLGIGAIWGRYDYSLSTEESIDHYYSRVFEGQSGWRFMLVPKVGLLISTNHLHAFGLEVSMPYCMQAWRLENQLSFNLTLNYTFIID
ncbi:MAG: hypothetical protein II256_03820 [Bacteroidales bacterium]|nr:hypothetical protein [Bacteroidales bacterium]MEE0992805.1 hypothetical protein [Bacteroidales bacterium]MEE1001732.1 hypothetical protein [Bacteroidales bacterium]